MATSSSFKRSQFWRSDWFAGVLLVLGVTALHLSTNLVDTLERRFYDFASSSMSRQPASQIAIIAIDDQSIASIGPWPWSQGVRAKLIDRLVGAKAKTIVDTALLLEPQPDRGRSFIRKMKAVLASAGDSASTSVSINDQLNAAIAEAETALNTDDPLALSMRNATHGSHNTNVIVATVFTRVETPAKSAAAAFAVDSFDDVLSGKIPASKYRDKVVVIGATAASLLARLPVPGQPALSPIEAIARMTSSLLNEPVIVPPFWGPWLTLAVLLLLYVYLIVALPRLPAARAALITFLLLSTLLGTEFGFLSGAALWLKLVFPATLLLFGYLGLTAKRCLITETDQLGLDQTSAETKRMMGLALQGQGQLDMAFDHFRQVPMGSAVMENLYALALDFERKRQFDQAAAVYQHMSAFQSDYKDLSVKLKQTRSPSEPRWSDGSRTHAAGTLLLARGAAVKPMLGRYQVERELGQGAMGIVYLGKDPKIGRWVAIKTMALGDEFEGAELLNARELFFREAQTAGRLQHQNIVTIFDAGEEHELAYIAMEFLKGKNLVDFCQAGHLLPVPTVLSIVARVAQALAFAHREQVVHRDIKPANVMYEMESDTVKVTDFGIARITGSSKTKTGLVLGTPSYMSPEQLAGNRVDGRSDLYALGVMLFQMLSGSLPFGGQSIAELMYKIAKQEAPDIRTIRAELPEKLAQLVAKSLNKLPAERYQDGDQLALELHLLLSVSPGLPESAQLGAVLLPPTKLNQPTAAFTATRPAAATEFEKTIIITSSVATDKPANASPIDLAR